MCDKNVSKEPFMLKYCLGRYKTQGMCYKAVDTCLLALKSAADWFATDKIPKKLDDVFSNDDITFVNTDSDNATFLLTIWTLLL